jgi:alanyl-tRNA synthetase
MSFITITGTSDGKMVVDGIWKIFETHGLPLDIILTLCLNKGWVPDWIALYKQMKQSGMKHGRILSKLEEAISDSFGKEFSEVVISRLDQIFKQ